MLCATSAYTTDLSLNVPILTQTSVCTAGEWRVKARPERAASPAAHSERKRSAKTSTWPSTALVSVSLGPCLLDVFLSFTACQKTKTLSFLFFFFAVFDQLDVISYEEVVRLPAFKRKTLVLIGKRYIIYPQHQSREGIIRHFCRPKRSTCSPKIRKPLDLFCNNISHMYFSVLTI